MDSLLVGPSSPTDEEFGAAAVRLGVSVRVVRDRFSEARRAAFRSLGGLELSPIDLASPSVSDAATRTGRPGWAVRMALERTPGRAPLRLLADKP